MKQQIEKKCKKNYLKFRNVKLQLQLCFNELHKNPAEAQSIFSHLRKNLEREPNLQKT